MNATLIIFGILILVLGLRGYRVGITKEIAGLVALMVTLFVIALIIMIYIGFRREETVSTVASVVLLVIVGLVYGAVRIFFKSAGILAKLPLLRFLDKALGLMVGAGEGVLIIWLLYILNIGGILGRFGEMMMADTAESRILLMLYEYNYLVRFILSVA